jgi:hypothetical protein
MRRLRTADARTPARTAPTWRRRSAAFVVLTLLADTVVVIVVRMSAASALEDLGRDGPRECPIIAAKPHQFWGMPRRRNPV